ncbi:Cytochrome p450 [Thalictrum thalictroides]|uniref:Cytochrome p450 n=1 Tax=Thalictrum thalictroides TaxID=46969 RepID=A0A7J6WA21_THATH|nr:Cytochrome p450 [Thalictrum thalictroides]
MWLQLGAMNTVIIQSTEAAKEMFKKHDLTYSGRTITEAMRACSFNQGAMSVAQYGPYWRAMKRLWITELATNKQVHETAEGETALTK